MIAGLQGIQAQGTYMKESSISKAAMDAARAEGRGLAGMPTTVYEQAQALTRAFLELNPPSRTTAEVVNLLLGSMDPLSRQRTIRALCEVYEAAPGMLGVFP